METRPRQTHPHMLAERASGGSYCRRLGFTLIELLVVISIIALLVGILLPSLGAARDVAKGIKCATQMRQLSLAASIYADAWDDRYPPRATDPRWVSQFNETYVADEMLICPNDEVASPGTSGNVDDNLDRSYMFNGFNDMLHDDASTWSQADTTAMIRSKVKGDSNLILFGEKLDDVTGYWVDIYSNSADPLADINQSRHGKDRGGYSNYSFVDLSTRTYGFDETIQPTLLWAVRPELH